MPVNFYTKNIEFTLKQKTKTREWIKKVIDAEGYQLANLNFIFCSDDFLKSINNQYLKHNYYTDVLTFDNSEQKTQLEGDIFISIDRVMENAVELGVGFEMELRRVMVHGVLHLIGYNDKKEEELIAMRNKEDQWLREVR